LGTQAACRSRSNSLSESKAKHKCGRISCLLSICLVRSFVRSFQHVLFCRSTLYSTVAMEAP
jgi:hypothetical protein